MWLRDTGVLGKIKDDELSAPRPLPDRRIKVDERISIEQIGIGVAIYSAGMVLSLLFFIREFCTKKRPKTVGNGLRRPRKEILKPLNEKNETKRGPDIIMPHNMGPQTVSHK